MKKKYLIIIFAFLVILAFSAGLIYFLRPPFLFSFFSKNPKALQEDLPSPKEKGFMYKMDPLVVNLANPERLHYLKLKIDLESMESKPNEEFEKRLPQIRDSIILLLSTKEREDLMYGEGKNKLRAEIKERINLLLKNFKIKEIYFTEFLIQ